MKNLIMVAIGVALGIAGYMVVNEYCTSHSATVKIQGIDSDTHHGYDNGSDQHGTTSSGAPKESGHWDNKSINKLTKQAEKDLKAAV